MNPISASRKVFAMGCILARHPRDIRFAARWLKSVLPGQSPLHQEIPWFTFRAIEWLESYLKPHMSLFEYGSGGSSLFLARRARSVISVEHDEQFYNVLKDLLVARHVDNCELILCRPERFHELHELRYGISSFTSAQAKYAGSSFERYVKTIDAYPDGSFDLVVVDGRARASCLARAIPKVRPGGHLLLDNSERPGYSGALALLGTCPRLDFFGVVPWNLETYRTSIWRIDQSGNARR